MKTCIVIIWFLTLSSAFVLGYGWGVSQKYDEVERVVLFQHNQQINEAVKDGIPFKIKGSEISIIPSKDGSNSVLAVKLEKTIKAIKQASE